MFVNSARFKAFRMTSPGVPRIRMRIRGKQFF